ncbi:hypothetical protein [Novosphingobium sp. ST904]|uniref:hypothetical protein n=1 Tax=Novosphingobium sp. ST904 TaxID=1684385 RepID=UPI0012E12DB9|nr:hypothetical protein [Novosphingobium sp. ST904]
MTLPTARLALLVTASALSSTLAVMPGTAAAQTGSPAPSARPTRTGIRRKTARKSSSPAA